MKPKFCRFSLVSALLPVLLGAPALAGTFTWLNTVATPGAWDVAANWDLNSSYPSAADDVAIFNKDFTATYNVSLNTGTLGSTGNAVIKSLSVTDSATATAYDFFINNGTGMPSLTFDTAAPTIVSGLAGNRTLTINPTVNLNTANSILAASGAGYVAIANPGASFFSNLNPTGGLSVTGVTLKISYVDSMPALATLKTGTGGLQLNLTDTSTFFQTQATISGTGNRTFTNVRSFADALGAPQTLINASTGTLDMQINPGSGPAFFDSLTGVSSTSGNNGNVTLNNIVGTINLGAKSFNTSAASARLILSGNSGAVAASVVNGGSFQTNADLAIGEGITLNVDSNTGTFSVVSLMVTSGNSNFPSTNGDATVNWNATGKTLTGSLSLGWQGGTNPVFNMLGGSLTPGGGLDFGQTSHPYDSSFPVVNVSAGTLAVPTGKNLSMSAVNTDGAKVRSTLNISGTGLLDLTNANAINLGTRVAGSGASTISNATINLNGGTLKLGKAINRVAPGINTGSGSSSTVQFYFNGGTLQAGAAVADVFTGFGTATATNDGIFVSSAGALIDTQAFAMGIAANIQENSGSLGGNLTKTGSGTLSLSGTNTYTGGTFVNAGSVGFLKTAAIPATGTVTVADGATLGLGILGTGAFTAADVDNLFAHNLVGSLANVTWLGAYSFGIDTTSGSTSYDTSVAATSNGLSKVGSNTLTLTGTNLYTGPTTISAGVLSVAADANLGNANAVVFDGGTLQVTGTALTNLNTHTVIGNATKTVALDINNAANTFTISQALNQTTGGLTKVGAGTLILSGTNTYSGGSSVTTGTLAFAGTGALPTSGVLTLVGALNATATASIRNDGTGNGGTISLPTNNVLVTSAYGILNVANNGGSFTGNTVALGTLSTPNGTITTTTFTGGNGYNLSFSGLALPGANGQTTTLSPTTTSLTIAGNVTNPMAGFGTGNYDTLVLDGTSTGNAITGVISNATGGTNAAGGYTKITKNNSSTWTLAGASTYTGATAINGGILKAGVASVANVSGAFGLNSYVTLANAASTVMDLNGYNTQTGSLGGGGPLGGNVTLGSATLTLGGDNGNNTFAGVISGTGGLTKIGSGTQMLSTASTYSGETLVSAGTLRLTQNNSLSNSSAVRLVTGAALNLNFSGTDTVERLYIDGTEQAPGIWGGTGSSAPNKSALITGGGLLSVLNGVSAGYAGWESTNGLTGAGATADSDHDGLPNGIEFVIGGVSSGTNTDSNALLIPPTLDATYLTYVFRRTSASAAYNPGVEYGSTLTGWTQAVAGEPALTPVLITVLPNDFGAGIDRVTVQIPRALATGQKMFARLQVMIP